MAVLVSAVNGVEARTQTSPDASLIAVERPPILNNPSRVNGLVKVKLSQWLINKRGKSTRREGPDIVGHLEAKSRSEMQGGGIKNSDADFTYYYIDHGDVESSFEYDVSYIGFVCSV